MKFYKSQRIITETLKPKKTSTYLFITHFISPLKIVAGHCEVINFLCDRGICSFYAFYNFDKYPDASKLCDVLRVLHACYAKKFEAILEECVKKSQKLKYWNLPLDCGSNKKNCWRLELATVYYYS